MVLRNGARKGPKLCWSLHVVEWGCGSNCVVFAVIDARNGKVYDRDLPPINDGYPCGLLYESGSTLFVVEKSTRPDSVCEPTLYTWDGSHLVPVGLAPRTRKQRLNHKLDSGRRGVMNSVAHAAAIVSRRLKFSQQW